MAAAARVDLNLDRSWGREDVIRRGVRGLLVLATAIAALAAVPAQAVTITHQIGTPASNCATGCTGVGNTLTGMLGLDATGFIEAFDFAIQFEYGPVSQTILSAFIEIDLIDADGGLLSLFAGGSNAGPLIGIATGLDQGLPGPFRGLGVGPPNASVDNLIVIPPGLFPDLADGVFQVFLEDTIGGDDGLTFWASNRAKLTIDLVPEPSTALLALTGLCILAAVGRHPRRS